ncbi:DUF4012 domain-containing protein [Demequina litorisediminis]|uniref:Uncharacterized protein n=1 Tax=Demequina litorisediminis TaxID=1849022 RepID=A0ABQ6ICV5_9MICO|nr:DUF4012 domain-containing protein [Demequina litorisediminis]GMA35190.1 hypothetical protein GCM10025876_13940 [Demequina litorisediminis]
MLGGDGPRNYVVMIQNNAEPRTSGGISGTVIGLAVDDGRFEVTQYVEGNSMVDTSDEVTPLTDDERRIFTEKMAWYPQDVNFTPEFPRAAEIMAAFWERETGQVPDGVVSLDPVALGYMLEGMPSTDIGGIEVTADNVAQVLLSDAYWEYPEPEQSDAFFALASRELFGVLMSGDTAIVGGIEKAIGEGRFLLWSATDTEQDLIVTTPWAPSGSRTNPRSECSSMMVPDPRSAITSRRVLTWWTTSAPMAPWPHRTSR